MTTTPGRLIVIVGPTASGKTSLALDLAESHNGEIVCADSRTIYRGMDIGTAKPTESEQMRVPHHLLDVIDPGEQLSAAAFKLLASEAIESISARGRVPFLVGGSGLYLDSILFDYVFPSEADPELRSSLETMSDEQLQKLLAVEDEAAYDFVDLANRRRVIRAIETAGENRSRRANVIPGSLVLGLTLNKEVAQNRIQSRVKKMLAEGFLDEVKRIGTTYGWDSPALEIIGYRAMKDVVLGSKTLEDGEADFVRGDIALYKKQVTWFKRNKAIRWLENEAQAEALVREFLAGSV